MAKQLSIHPICNVFPAMDGDELAALVEDIRDHGQREPIIVHQNQIIDGRNRWEACRRLKIKPKSRKWDGKGGSLIDFVVSMNLRRRQLDTSQRAMVAAELATLKDGQRQVGKFAEVATQSEAAEALGISARSVGAAVAVKESGTSSLVDAVKAGEVPVSVAASIATLPTPEQVKIMREAERTGESVKTVAARHKKKAMTKEEVIDQTRKLRSGKETITPGMRKEAKSLFGKLVRILDKMKLSPKVESHLEAIRKAIDP